MEFQEIAALGREPTPADLEPFLTAYLEQHGPTKRVDLARATESAWIAIAGRPLQTNAMSKLKNALEHMQARGTVAPTGAFGVWGLVDDEARVPSGGDEEQYDDESLLDLEVETAAELELGEGEQFVYCFYLPTYRDQAERAGESRWPIKIGSTTGPLAARLASFSTALPERPRMAVVIRTHDASLLEKALQTVLSYRGRWLSEAAGSEWYATNPDEIVHLYDLIRQDVQGG